MKRFLSGLLVALLLVGVGLPALAEETQTTLTYWQHSSEARNLMIDTLVEEFMAANPDITIEVEYIPYADYTTKLIAALATGTGPDVFQIQSGMVSTLASVGSIQPMDETIMPADTIAEDFVASTVGALMYEGQYYGMPTDTQTIIVIWNKALVEAAGLDAENGPSTWEELFDWARTLTVKDEDGQLVQVGWGTNGYWPEVQSYIESMGGSFYDEETGEFVFADDPISVAAVETMAALYREDGVYDVEFGATWASFRQGLVGVMLGHPAMIGNLATTAPDVELGIGLIPGNGDNRVTTVTSWAYVMSSQAPTAEATRFIEFLGSEEVEKRWTLTTGELPARVALLTDEELNADPKLATAIASLNNSVVGKLQLSSLNTIWGTNWEKIQLTDESIASILTTCQDELNEELASN